MGERINPGVYEIVPYHAEHMALNVWEMGNAPGAEVKLYGRDPNARNMVFFIQPLHSSYGNDDENNPDFVIESILSGLLLASNPIDDKVTVESRPRDDRTVRWKLVFAGNGAWYINTSDGQKQLNVRGSGTHPGTEIITYRPSDTPNCQFWLKQVNV